MSGTAGEEAAERAKSRRRLLTLAEFVAVAGLMVAALTLYLNWSQRRSDAADKAAAASAQRQLRTVVDGGAPAALLGHGARQRQVAQLVDMRLLDGFGLLFVSARYHRHPRRWDVVALREDVLDGPHE